MLGRSAAFGPIDFDGPLRGPCPTTYFYNLIDGPLHLIKFNGPLCGLQPFGPVSIVGPLCGRSATYLPGDLACVLMQFGALAAVGTVQLLSALWCRFPLELLHLQVSLVFRKYLQGMLSIRVVGVASIPSCGGRVSSLHRDTIVLRFILGLHVLIRYVVCPHFGVLTLGM